MHVVLEHTKVRSSVLGEVMLIIELNLIVGHHMTSRERLVRDLS